MRLRPVPYRTPTNKFLTADMLLRKAREKGITELVFDDVQGIVLDGAFYEFRDPVERMINTLLDNHWRVDRYIPGGSLTLAKQTLVDVEVF